MLSTLRSPLSAPTHLFPVVEDCDSRSFSIEASMRQEIRKCLIGLPYKMTNSESLHPRLQKRMQKGHKVSRNIIKASNLGSRLLGSRYSEIHIFSPDDSHEDSRARIYRAVIHNPNRKSVVETALILPVLQDWRLLVQEFKDDDNIKDLANVIDVLFADKLIDKYTAAIMGVELGIPFGILNELFSPEEMPLWITIKGILYSKSKFDLKLAHIANAMRIKEIKSPLSQRVRYYSHMAIIVDLDKSSFEEGYIVPVDVTIASPRPSYSNRLFSPISSKKNWGNAIDLVSYNLKTFYKYTKEGQLG